MHLSRLSVADVAAVGNVVRDTYGHHQQVWRFFAGDPDARREFVYRYDLATTGPRFHIVSAQPPANALPGWTLETRSYEPSIETGARLRFSLRANPTKRVAEPGKRADGQRHDVVMARKRVLQVEGREIDTADIVQEEGLAWLKRQGARHGFDFHDGDVRADGYGSHRFRKTGGKTTISVTGIDYEGMLRVTDAALFGEALRTGIGPAKGFGFGLLLVRRP